MNSSRRNPAFSLKTQTIQVHYRFTAYLNYSCPEAEMLQKRLSGGTAF
ncbi:hypothetical protein [Flavobacterium limi]|nr:hypothetical protein [Flavobacterium limi]